MVRYALSLLLAVPFLLGMKPVDPANRIEEGQLPTPYGAAQIKAACAPGTLMTYKVEQPGKEPHLQITRFVAGAEGKAAFEAWTATVAGEPQGSVRKVETEWTSLQRHAAFAEATCKLSEREVRVAAGTYACWVYSVEQDDGKLAHFDFAQDLPGPPVRLTIVKDGVTLYSMELLSRIRLP